MNDFSKRTRACAMASLFMLLTLFALTGCGGDVNDAGSTPPPASTKAMVGAEGGTVNGPDGVQVVIAAGALDKPTDIGISNDGSGASEIGGIKPISKVYAVTPHGTEFAESARINLPFNPADVGAGGQPVIIKSQPGGTWSALASEVVGSTVSADISGFSYYAVGTCYTSRDRLVGGPDPTLACPTIGNFTLRLQDGSGASLPVPRTPLGTALPAMTVTVATRLQFTPEYNRPPGISRGELLSVWAYGAGLTPAEQPLTNFSIQGNTPATFLNIDPARVPGAGRPGGVVVRVKGWVEYTTDAFYLGCLCFKPASWTFEAEVPLRVIYTGPITPPPPPVATYTVGGSISGLTGAGLVLRNNGANNLSLAANVSAFTFAAPVNAGSAYNVTVFAQPTGQTCTVTNGSGTASAAVTNVAVACVATVTYTVGGNVSGLTGAGMVLQNNGANNLAVAANGAFGFATAVNAGAPYAVTVLTQPAGQICTVANGAGTANTNVSNVVVTCVAAGAGTGPLVIVANSGVSSGTNGLAVYRASPSTGQLSFVSNANTGNSPFAVAVTPNGQYAYVSNQQGGSVSSYSINAATGVLSPIPLSSPGSNNASGIAMDRLGRFIWVANYGFHTVSAFSVGADGVLTAAGSPLTTTTTLPYAIAAHPTQDFVYVAHQSTTHAVSVYSVNPANGTLTHQQTLTNVIVAANGLVIDPMGRFAYAVSSGGGVCAFIINAGSGNLSKGACATPPGGGGTFSVAIHPNGQYLYTTNDSTLDNVAVFSINQTTGALTQVGSPVTAGANPRGVTVGPGGNYLYVANYIGNTVSTFSLGGGASLTPQGVAVATGGNPVGVGVAP